jgi:hypothetical protein
MQRAAQNLVREGVVLVTSMLGKKGSGTPIQLASFWNGIPTQKYL